MPTHDEEMRKEIDAENQAAKADALLSAACAICGRPARVGDLCARCWRDEQQQAMDDADADGDYGDGGY